MPSEYSLQPILEDVDLEAQDDSSLLKLETYKKFTLSDWWKCSKLVIVLCILVALLALMIYIVFYSLKKY